MRWCWFAAVAVSLLSAGIGAGCTDLDIPGRTWRCTTDDECGNGWRCESGICLLAAGHGEQDAVSSPAADGGTDAAAVSDAARDTAMVLRDVTQPTIDVPADVPGFDWQPGDLRIDRTAPFVVSIWPDEHQVDVPLDFVVRVEFSEPLRPTTVVRWVTFSVTDLNGDAVEGSLGFEPSDDEVRVVTFTPTQTVLAASPYDVELTPSIRDLAGNGMEDSVRVRFYTVHHRVPATHRSLAERYAPTIAQETFAPQPELDYLVALDFDEDWDLSNNVNAVLAAQTLRAEVYYSVVETKSHYFVTYAYYHPYRRADDLEDRLGNDLAGAQVVVARYPAERPILVQTYFKAGEQEDVLAYATAESGLSGAYIDESWPEAELFPGGHYRAYLSTGNHESCLLLDRNNTTPQRCVLDATHIPLMIFVEYVYKGGQGEYLFRDEEGGFPATSGASPVGYGLLDLLERVWPRRLEVTPRGAMFDDSYVYPSNQLVDQSWRPGRNLALGSRFVNPVGGSEAFGRPPWAWQWRPFIGGFVDLARGTFFLDPAYFVRKRFAALEEWDPDAKTGFSLDYCLNPYLDIDLLGIDADCP